MSDLTAEEWKEAVRRLCIIADWPRTLARPSAVGPDGTDWCAEAEKFDVEANARAVLDDETVLRWNDMTDEGSWLMKRLLGRS